MTLVNSVTILFSQTIKNKLKKQVRSKADKVFNNIKWILH